MSTKHFTLVLGCAAAVAALTLSPASAFAQTTELRLHTMLQRAVETTLASQAAQ